jgi:hypothetical protein
MLEDKQTKQKKRISSSDNSCQSVKGAAPAQNLFPFYFRLRRVPRVFSAKPK